MPNLLDWRREFPTCETSVHLISHSLGAMPRRAREALNEFADTWTNRGVRAWEEGWWEMPIEIGDLVGKVIGAEPGEITMHQNVSMAQGIVNSCFDWTAKRNKIVTESMNFPTNLYGFHELERSGARLVTVPLEGLIDAIDEETRLVAVSHVLFRSSYVQDIAAIARRAHDVGALMVADLYQSAGVYPVNVREAGVDFATGGSVKWLCGGPGAGYLYVRRELWPALEPRLTGWMAHSRPFDFEAGAIDFAVNSFRFLHGTPNIPALYSARSGYEIVAEIGVDAIRANSIRQTSRLIELALEAGFKVNSPLDPKKRGGVVIVDVPRGAEVNRELSRRDILVDYRPGAGIRIGPHFYNTDDELDLVIHEMRDISDGLAS
jgi:kynureninase